MQIGGMRTSLLIFAIVLAGCERVEPGISDADYKAVLAGNPGLTDACKQELRKTGMYGVTNDDCYEMMSPQRWKGIWNGGWEWSNFCPAPATTCSVRFERNEMDLGFGGAASPKIAKDGGMFEIEFVGRQSQYAGHYGHLDQYPHMILVDRMISIRQIAGPVD